MHEKFDTVVSGEVFMRQFYIFKIKEEYALLTKKNPYHLYKTFEQIYYVDRSEINLGFDLFEKIIDVFNPKKMDIELFKKYKDNYFYTKYSNVHEIHDVYKRENTKLKVCKTFLEMESTVVRPTFMKDLEGEKNLFFCDFENKDYFWLEKMAI